MKISRVWKIYFSPTGTTKKVMDALTSGFKEEVLEYDFTLPAARQGFADVDEGDLVFFGVPTYAGRVPNVLLKYLDTIKGNGALAVPVVTFGNRNFDNSLIELRDILEKTGFHTVAGCAVSCEHSFSYTLGASRPDLSDRVELINFANQVRLKIIDMDELCAPMEVDGIPETYGGYYKPQDRNGNHIDIRKVIPKVSDACTDCGICAEVCPMGSIVAEDVRQMQGICIKCGACYKKCPEKARYFDDPGYLYHKEELEAMYERRAENKYFL
ncbi:MAG: EFR1 family ferrodoxin [Firmicutes bacterium]|nr:EFR1 family ferrodoxin [Bacillota bacterium]